MGQMAVEKVMHGCHQHAIVVRNDHVECVPLSDCSKKSDHAMSEFVGIAEALSI